MQKEVSTKKKLAFGSIPAIVLGVFLVVCGQGVAYGVISAFLSVSGMKLSLLQLVNLLQNMPLYGLIPQVFGAGLLTYLLMRSRFQVNVSKLKRQIVKVSVLAGIAIILICAFFVSTPLVRADAIATSNYYLDTPLPIANAYVGQYTNSSYFAIDGATWNNFIVNSNLTVVEQAAIADISSGNVWMEVPFNYNVTIPPNISVTENVNGMQRVFINSANSQGSPYTISVDTVNSGYYLAQDSADRYINSWSSTNATSVIDSATAINGADVLLMNGLYPASVTINGNNVVLEGQGRSTILQEPPTSTVDVIENNWVTGNNNITIENLQIDGNAANVITPLYQKGIEFQQAHNCLVYNCYIHNTVIDCCGCWHGCTDCTFQNNEIGYAGQHNGIFIECNAPQPLINADRCSGCKVLDNDIYNVTNGSLTTASAAGVIIQYGYNCIVSGNTISNCFQAIYLDDVATGCNILVQGNTINDSSYGIYLNSNSSTVIGNSISNSLIASISLRNASDNLVTSNSIFNSSTTVSYGDAIYVDSISNGNSILDNMIDHFGQTGFVTGQGIDVGGSYNIIENNHILDDVLPYTSWAGIMLYGASYCVVGGNTIQNMNRWAIYSDESSVNLTCYNTYYQNLGYNPVGIIASPITNTLDIADRGGNPSLSFTNNTVYMWTDSNGFITLTGGTYINIYINGVADPAYAGSANSGVICIPVQSGQTFKYVDSANPTVVSVQKT
ncbi:MAG: right-handed parallel beta-helix repeat-containing protein [Candidatus Bathyarchaeia archaeon]|jgi:parallel beta-helix repeat protein